MFASFPPVSMFVAAALVSSLAVGCAEQTASSGETGTVALSASRLLLPDNDPCRKVLGPLALGLADGIGGVLFTKSVTIALRKTSPATRDYVAILESEIFAPIQYDIQLANDDARVCVLKTVTHERVGKLPNFRQSEARSEAGNPPISVTITPANDDCLTTVTAMAQAAAMSLFHAKLESSVVTAQLDGVQEDRGYQIHMEGEGATTKAANFFLVVSNDSASKCFVDELVAK